MRNHVSAYKDHMLQAATVEQRAVSIVKREQEREIEGLSSVLSANNMVKDRAAAAELLSPEVLAVLAEDVDSEEVIELLDIEGGELPSLTEALTYNVASRACARHRRHDNRPADEAWTGYHLKYDDKALNAYNKREINKARYFGIEDIVLNKDGSLKAACKPKLSKEEKRKLRFAKRMATKGAAK
ncbi:MAG: hypothetical protein HRU12_08890 [Phaeodactylibacter sp.]|nr:hypothetical protein [Phaeodactylibacter sp.]